jgi:hypothetical protein
MWDRFLYYVDLINALCGFDGTDNATVFGWVMVAIAFALVLYAFYTGHTDLGSRLPGT